MRFLADCRDGVKELCLLEGEGRENDGVNNFIQINLEIVLRVVILAL